MSKKIPSRPLRANPLNELRSENQKLRATIAKLQASLKLPTEDALQKREEYYEYLAKAEDRSIQGAIKILRKNQEKFQRRETMEA